MTLNELENLNNVDILENNILVDIQKINIDNNKSDTEKMLNFLYLVKNPYCFMCENTPVKICFASNEITLGDKLKKYFLYLKQNI